MDKLKNQPQMIVTRSWFLVLLFGFLVSHIIILLYITHNDPYTAVAPTSTAPASASFRMAQCYPKSRLSTLQAWVTIKYHDTPLCFSTAIVILSIFYCHCYYCKLCYNRRFHHDIFASTTIVWGYLWQMSWYPQASRSARSLPSSALLWASRRSGHMIQN